MHHHNLGLEYIQSGRVAESVAHEELAVALKPDAPEPQNNLGFGLFRLGRVEEAWLRHIPRNPR